VTLTLLVCKRDIRQPAMIICGEQDTAEIKLKLLGEMHRNGVGVGDVPCGQVVFAIGWFGHRRVTSYGPNETELSRRWRKRALLQSLMLKSCKSYSSELPAVDCSDWLDLIVATISTYRT